MSNEATRFDSEKQPAKRGRPPGSGALDKLKAHVGEERTKEIIDAMCNAAIKGDVKAAETLLSRLVPQARATGERVYLPELKEPGLTLVDRAERIVAAVADGRITSSAARELLGVLRDAATVITTTDLQARLERLEGKGRTIDVTPKRVKDEGDVIEGEATRVDDGEDLL